MKKQLLIVDGYNMIGAWPELAVLKETRPFRRSPRRFVEPLV